MNKPTTLAYKHYHIPTSYIGLGYSDMNISKAKAMNLEDKLSQAPPKGLLVIKGNAAPIVNQLFQSRTTRGIDFTERSNSAFGTHINPEADVVVIHSVGEEVTTNYSISSQVLHALLKFYKRRNTLVIVETHFTKAELRNNYDLLPTNFLVLEDKADEVFI